MIESINPSTEEVLESYQEMSPLQVRQSCDKAYFSFLSWSLTAKSERAQLLRRAAAVVRDKAEVLAALATAEMGKPIREARAEVEKCAWVCDFYADNGEKFLQDEVVPTDAERSFVTFQPLGVVLGVMPWNFPFWQVFRYAVPTLMAGNTTLLKHASNVFGCALAIEEIFLQAGFPSGVFQTLLIGSKEVEAVIDNPFVRAVTLTGSAPAGSAVAAAAGKRLKKSVLELGGSDPYVILQDADLETASTVCVQSRLHNAGQTCISAKRFIVVKPVLKPFTDLFVEKMRAAKVDDPSLEATDVGPLAKEELRKTLHQQVVDSVNKGARLLLGGTAQTGRGFFYPPTVLANVTKGMDAFDEETFGPVAAIVSARDETEAIRLANDSPYGLGAAVFTEDKDKGEKIAREQLQAGACFVNAQVRSDPRLPFGGTKDSGFGRELSHYGIKEFTNIKTVYVR